MSTRPSRTVQKFTQSFSFSLAVAGLAAEWKVAKPTGFAAVVRQSQPMGVRDDAQAHLSLPATHYWAADARRLVGC